MDLLWFYQELAINHANKELKRDVYSILVWKGHAWIPLIIFLFFLLALLCQLWIATTKSTPFFFKLVCL